MDKTGETVVTHYAPKLANEPSTALNRPSASFLSAHGLSNILLLSIAVALLAIALRPLFIPLPARAESHPERRLFIEPGVHLLHTSDLSRNVYGRVVVDLRTGDVWGFPTPTGDLYPFQPTNGKLETSHPFLLGRFALEDLDK
jgi:hypothetical protein